MHNNHCKNIIIARFPPANRQHVLPFVSFWVTIIIIIIIIIKW